jgi:lycopene cyclase domain-containing protein
MPADTALATLAAVAVIVGELVWLRTGLFRQRAFWLALLIVFAFQCLVDGWLTKLSAPIVVYNRAEFGGRRFPWDIPVEDFLYGFALVTSTMLLWQRHHETRSR